MFFRTLGLMLEGIDDAAFAKASHAYGKAKDVPELLRRLLARSEATRANALFELGAAICHQGTLYSATPLAVPHLLELVASAKVKGRAGILRLLADIVTLDDQPAEFFAGAWRYFDACPTTKIADRALEHVAQWKPKDPWGGAREKNADPVLKSLIEAFEAAGNHADAKRLEEAYEKLK